MKIFWVEDFGDQSARSSDRVSLTRTYMGPVLDAFWKSGSGENNWEQSANEDALVFMRTLASNASPIVWADSLASGLAALELGTQAFKVSKYETMPVVTFPYDVAILDLDIPPGENDGILDEARRTEDANALAHLFYQESSELLSRDFMDYRPNCAGVILALKLIQKGMPPERIFFLTGHGSAISSTAKALLGSMIQEQCLAKTSSDIEKLRYKIRGNSYYMSRELVLNTIFLFREKSMCATQQKFPFTEKIGSFKLNDKNNINNLLDEIETLFSSYFPGNHDEILRYRIGVDLMAKHFEALGAKNENGGGCKGSFLFTTYGHYTDNPTNKVYEYPARHAARFLKNIRNVYAHSSYFNNVGSLEFGIIYIVFLNFIRAFYGLPEDDFLPFIENFLSEYFPEKTSSSIQWSNKEFIQSVSDEYRHFRPSGWPFCRAMANFPPNLQITPWEIVRVNFWSQISFSYFEDYKRAFFDKNAFYYVQGQSVPRMLADVLAQKISR